MGDLVRFGREYSDRSDDALADLDMISAGERGGRPSLFVSSDDISAREEVQPEMEEQMQHCRQELLAAILDKTPAGILIIDEKTHRIAEFNDFAASMHGYTREEFATLTISDLNAVKRAVLDKRQRRVEKEGTITFEDVHRRKDGSFLDLQVSLSRLHFSGGWYTLSVWTDISDHKSAQRALSAREEEVRSLVENSPDGMVRYDRDLRRVYVNPTMRNFIGRSVSEIIGRKMRKPAQIIAPDAYTKALKETFRTGRSHRVEVDHRGRHGERRSSLVTFSPERNAAEEIVTVLAVVRDITELVSQRERIQQLAYNDPLTGLANRAAFNNQFSGVLAACRETGSSAALLVFDIDRFKDINDSLGAVAGDEVLRRIGARLSAEMRPHDIFARVGGDEFAVLLPHCRGKQDAEAVVERIHRAFLAPFQLGDREIFPSAAIGIALYPDDGGNADELFAHAEVAIYGAKTLGRGGVQFYTRELSRNSALRLALSADLTEACANGEFQLLYQPKVALSDGTCIGAEALLRWRHPERGMISPELFIPLAEETGAIVEIGRWVLLEACRVAAEWNRLSPVPLRIAVNFSSRQFIANDTAADVRHALAETGCLGEWLECEITESLILRNEEGVHNALAEIGKMGVTIAIDDFGTGHSALSYLNRFHVDVLKIDRSFVGNMECDWRKEEMVKAFISLADALEMETVAEGVENSDQGQILHRLGCQIGQGYYYGQPLSSSEFRQRFLV